MVDFHTGLVVGHTPQSSVNAACNGLVWRVDTGMSKYVAGGAREALEIDGGACRVHFSFAADGPCNPMLSRSAAGRGWRASKGSGLDL